MVADRVIPSIPRRFKTGRGVSNRPAVHYYIASRVNVGIHMVETQEIVYWRISGDGSNPAEPRKTEAVLACPCPLQRLGRIHRRRWAALASG